MGRMSQATHPFDRALLRRRRARAAAHVAQVAPVLEDVAERLLSCMGRVFTKFLQMYGFTCGLEDFLMKPSVEAERVRILSLAKERSASAAKVSGCFFLLLSLLYW